MSHPMRIAAIAGLACLLASPAGALQIVPVQDARVVSWVLENGTPQQMTPGPGFPDFHGQLNIIGGPSTSQDTSVDPTQMGGTGAVFVNTVEATDARSDFDVTFQVDEAAQYDLSGTSYYGPTQVLLFGPGGVLYDGTGPSSGYTFSDTGALVAGVDYRLLVAVEVPDLNSGYGEWEFTFGVSPLPEPGAVLLLAVGVAAARRLALSRPRRAVAPSGSRRP
jgi:hypothetical protein